MKRHKRPEPLKRTRDTFEFFVCDPFGSSVMNGYRRAARHFGLHTLEDPGSVGTDTFRMLIHKSAGKLRRVANALAKVYESGDDIEAEMLLHDSGVHWFDHDWSYWCVEADEGALDQLGWIRRVTRCGPRYRVTLRLRKPRPYKSTERTMRKRSAAPARRKASAATA